MYDIYHKPITPLFVLNNLIYLGCGFDPKICLIN